MRVLLWCPYVNLGGGKRLLRPIVTALARHPQIEKIRLAIPGSVTDILPAGLNKVEVVPLTEAQCRGWLTKGKWRTQPGKIRKVRAFIRYQQDRMTINGLLEQLQRDIDVVYVFWPHTVPYYPFRLPLVCMFQDVILLDYPEIFGSAATRIEHALLNDWLRGSQEVVASSRNTTRRIEQHFGIPASRFHLLPYHQNVLDEVEQDKTAKAPGALLATLPARYVFYPANIGVHKNHDALLVAWSRFARRHELSLVLVGYGVQVLNTPDDPTAIRNWREDALCGLIKRLGLKPGYDFHALGYVSDDDMVHVMNHAAALIMPTHTEGFGLPVLEALMRGIPVLCSDIPVFRETLAGRSAGILWFDPYSPNEMVDCLNTLLDDYPRYKQAAESGRQDARPDETDIATRYYTVFEAALQSHKGTR